MGGITDPAEEYFKDGIWGWDGSQWRKLGILFGYHSVLTQHISNTDASAGTNTLVTSAVEDNYLWFVQVAGLLDVNTAPSRVFICINRSGVDYPLSDTSTTAANLWLIWNGQVVLSPGDTIKGCFLSCTAGDDLFLRALGYKVSLA